MAVWVRARRGGWLWGAVLGAALAPACTGPNVERPASPPPARDPVRAEDPERAVAPIEDPVPETKPAPAPAPIGVRVSPRGIVVRARASEEAPFRGAIPGGEPFFVYELVEARGCRNEGWARVGTEAYACLEHAAPTEATPTILPHVPEGDLVPFTYAKPRKTEDGMAPVVHRWRSRHAFNAGKPHRDTLVADASYAFVQRRGNGRRPPLLIDAHERAVPAKLMRRYRPSEFAGRDLESQPLADGHTLVWTRIRDTEVLAEPSHGAEVVSRPAYHAQLEARASGEAWFEILDTGHGVSGFVDARHVRAWQPPPPEPRVAADELWIDVDLVEQALTVMRGERPIFATLVSTGKAGDATPTGLFRVYKKKALDDMRSAEGADDPYFVESVPWTQYFHREFALHTAYWHDLFGNRTSHGCVNLSPRDGARLYALTDPAPVPGWNSVTEHAAAPGTCVRIRKGEREVPDRRPSFSPAADGANE